MSRLPELPEDIVNRICCEAVKMQGIHPFAFEIKTLGLLDELIRVYTYFHGEEDGMNWLLLDLHRGNYGDGVHRIWRSMTPDQRYNFYILAI